MSLWEPFIAAFDVHGDEQDPVANKALKEFLAIWKPKHRVMGGDLFNLVALRRGASEEERRTSLKSDIEASNDWLSWFKPTDFLLGNHDQRLWRLAEERRGPISDLAQKCIDDLLKDLKSLGCNNPLPYDKRLGVLRLGHLKVIHGYCFGINAARRSAQIYGSVLMGHGHGIQHVAIEGVDNRVGRMCGCLCKLDLDYVSASLASLLWRHGWAYGVVNSKTGRYSCWQAEEIDGKWLLPTGYREI